jgi:bifunctional non-homologous end joining protein LigD
LKRGKAAASPTRKPALDAYATKRDFSRTPEPAPEHAAKCAARSKRAPKGHAFVVQRHAARRLHYDLRLELDGTLKSWAVTRGPTLTAGEKRLAVRTEDHPLEYLKFEGNIPKGEYGGGTMIVWDRGTWTPELDPQFGLSKGHLAFTLNGSRLKGKWHLVRIRPKPGEKTDPWLLFKSEDEFARKPGDPEITDEEATSALSGLTSDEIAAKGSVRVDHAARATQKRARKSPLPDVGKIRGARKKLLPTFVEPSLASPCGRPPSGAKWVHEIKHDGYRIQARLDGGKVKLLTRKNLDWTDRFVAIAKAVEELRVGAALLDGEIVVEEANGLSTFNGLQQDLSSGRQDRMRYHVFDLLYCDGYDLTPATLIERKGLLEQVLAELPAGSPMRFSEHLETDGSTMFEHAGRLGLEGIISKRRDLPYRSGRTDGWLKSMCVNRGEFLVLGYIPSTVAAGMVGALLLGYRKNGKLVYAGRVGTGWSTAEARSLKEQLEKITAGKPTFAQSLPAGADKGARWAAPQLVADIQFRGWSTDGMLLRASFKGIREDKSPDEVVLEEKPKGAGKGATKGAITPAAGLAGVTLTHPDRLLWDEGVSKQALAEFYAEIAGWILPHIAGRVLSVVRAPSGAQAKNFYAKHRWAGLNHVRQIEVGEKEPMIAIDDLAGLVNLVQGGVVEIHPWGSRADDLDRPDRLIFDLDPGEDVAWSEVIAAARAMRADLQARGLESFVKTSGGKGLHVVVPFEPRIDWDAAKAFTQGVAEAMSRAHPDRYVAIMSKRARHGRIFIDWVRNGRGATAVAAFSTRARPQAPVSTPLAWDELSEGLRSDHFTVDNLRERLDFLKHDPWEGFFKLRQRIKG